MKKPKHDDENTFRAARKQSASALTDLLRSDRAGGFPRDTALALMTQCQMVDYRIIKSPWRGIVNEND